MHPSTVQKWLPKTENEKPSSSETSSRSTQYVQSRISRAITRAVSTILPSSSNRHSNRATGNPPTCKRHYNSATGSTPVSGLSSILSGPSQSATAKPNLASQGLACGPTSPDTLLHAPGLKVTGATSSQVTNDQQSVRKEILPNPILRTNLFRTTPSFKCAGVTDPRVRSNRSRKPTLSTGTSTSSDPASRNPVSTTNYPHKDERVTSAQSACNSVAPSPVSGNSKPASRTYGGIINETGRTSRTIPLSPNSKLVKFTSDQPHFQSKVSKASADKSFVKVTTSDPKGKGVATVENPAEKRKASDSKSAYGSYEQWIKDHYITCSDRDLLDDATIPLGVKCQLCAIDLAFLPYSSGSANSTDLPVCAVLPCGHTSHASCSEQVYGSSVEPHCLSCACSPVESSKQS